MPKPSLARRWTARLATLVGRRPDAAPRPRPKTRLRLELLEDRCVPAALTVNSAADTAAPPAGTVTLRSAIAQAEADAAPDTINFAASLFGQTITLGGTALPTLTRGETITGPGAEALTINANNASRLFNITSATNVTLSGLTLTGGNSGAANNGGAILNNGVLTLTSDTFTNNTAVLGGGAVANLGATAQLTVNTCTFTQNSAGASGGALVNTTAGAQLTVNTGTFSSNTCKEGGAIFNDTGTSATLRGATVTGNEGGNSGDGAGIFNQGTMTVTATTLAFNTGRGTLFEGGGIRNHGSLSLTACAVYGNLAEGAGGGIFNDGPVCNITNSTIANNTSLREGGGIFVNAATAANLALLNDTITGNLDTSNSLTSAGGVSFSGGTFTMNNTIVALNHATGPGAPPDIRGAVSSGVNNFVGIGTAALTGLTNGTNGNQIGTAGTPLDPRLGPLQNNGGPTLSERPLTGSPVLNAGNNAAAASLAADQRGSARVVGPAVDIGSVEFQPPDVTFAVAVSGGGNPATQVPAGTAVTLTATVKPTSSDPNAPPTGTVTFLAGATVLGTATASNGLATLVLARPPIGHLSITAQYSGDLNYPGTASAASALFVVPPFTVGAYDPLRGTWSLRDANSAGGPTAGSFQFGGFGPSGFADGVVGDWTGDGQFTPAVFYPASGTWFIRTSNGPTNALVVPPFQFGGPTDIPIVGDFFGDGHFDVGVYDTSTSTFFLRHGLNSGAVTMIQFGSPQFGPFYPVAGDFAGTGTWTVGLVQLSTMTWFLKAANTQAAGATSFQWGQQNPAGQAFVLPVVGDWGGSGKSGIGLVVPVQGQPASPFNNQDLFLLRNEAGPGFADAGIFAFGQPGFTPVAGQWALPTNPLSYQLAEGQGPGAPSIPQAQLDAAVAAALGRLRQAGVSPAVLGRLASASYQLAALPAGQLGYTAQGHVQLSADGAGHGWFVDPTPRQDEEFSGGLAWAGSPAAGREDLLTVVLHEMGHLVGVDDGGAGLMAAVLPEGTRRTAALDAVFAG